jgi:hypothetical protein
MMATGSSVTCTHYSVRYKITLRVNWGVRANALKRSCGPSASARTQPSVRGHCPSPRTQLVPPSLPSLPPLSLARSLPPSRLHGHTQASERTQSLRPLPSLLLPPRADGLRPHPRGRSKINIFLFLFW